MTISLPPTAPSRQDPATFSDRADAFAAWLVGAVPQFNALAVGSNDSGNFQNITVSGQISGNAVTQSSTDTTAGRISTVGWMGLGALSLPVLDADAVNSLGTVMFRGDGSATSPFGETQWLILNLSRDNLRGFQIAGRNSGDHPRLAVRNAHEASSEVFSDWVEVVERGSNALGEYVRLLDGTQVCWMEITENDVEIDESNEGVFISPRFSPSYPADFSSPPVAQVSARRRDGDTSAIWCTIDNPPGVNSIDVRWIKAASGTHDVGMHITLHGRWR